MLGFKKMAEQKKKVLKESVFSKINKIIISKKNSIKKFFKKFKEKNTEKIKFILSLIGTSIAYGFAIGYILWAVFGVDFNIYYVPAYGLLFKLIEKDIIAMVVKILSSIKFVGR
jgi:hypothetical protein